MGAKKGRRPAGGRGRAEDPLADPLPLGRIVAAGLGRAFVTFCAARPEEEFRVGLGDVLAAAASANLRDRMDAVALPAALRHLREAARVNEKEEEEDHRASSSRGAAGADDEDGMDVDGPPDGVDHLVSLWKDQGLAMWHECDDDDDAEAASGAAPGGVTVGFSRGVNLRAVVSKALGGTPTLLVAGASSSSASSSASASASAAAPLGRNGRSGRGHGRGHGAGGAGGSVASQGGVSSPGVRTFEALDAAGRMTDELERCLHVAASQWDADLAALHLTDAYAPLNAVRHEWRRVTAQWRATWVDHHMCVVAKTGRATSGVYDVDGEPRDAHVDALLWVASERWRRLVSAYGAALEEGRKSLLPEHAAAFGYDSAAAELAEFLGAHGCQLECRPLSRGEVRAWGEAAREALLRWLNAHAAAWRGITVGIVKDAGKYDALVAAAVPSGGNTAAGWRHVAPELAAPLDALTSRVERERADVARERVALRARWMNAPTFVAGLVCRRAVDAFFAARADAAAEALLREEHGRGVGELARRLGGPLLGDRSEEEMGANRKRPSKEKEMVCPDTRLLPGEWRGPN